MDVIKLDAQARDLGKSATKAVRRDGEVPCVLYGPHQEPVHFRVPKLALRPLIFTAAMHRVEVDLGGQTYECILKKVDYHPVSDDPLHADFLALDAGESVALRIPVRLTGAGSAPGVKAGGRLVQALNFLEIACLPKNIPSVVEVDVSELKIGDTVHVDLLSVPDAEILTDPRRTIATVAAPKRGGLLDDEDGEATEGDEAADADAEGSEE
ncbi:MAG: 50S ribosomal protein L25 [Bacteroidota bacterium]